MALAQEFRIPGDMRSGRRHAFGDTRRGADRDGRLAHEQCSGVERRDQGIDRAVDLGQVGGGRFRSLGSAHADEVHPRPGRIGRIGGEAQPPRRQPALQHLVEARLPEGHRA